METNISIQEPSTCVTPQKSNRLPSLTSEWIPACEEALKPVVHMIFESLKEGEAFYKRYAHHVGFSVRKGPETKKDGMKIWKRFFCSKEGYKVENKPKEFSSKGKEKDDGTKPKKKRRRLSRTGCQAMIAFKRIEDGKYSVAIFIETHTHELATPSKKQFLRSNRGVDYATKNWLVTCHQANIGTATAYRMLKGQAGGYENIGCTQRDLQNFHRDLQALIKDSDAHIFISNLEKKQQLNPSFFFAYELEDERLKHAFWADGISRKHYTLFGDIVSFDTTYGTNKYSMIFAPFTGLNQHRFCVTFAGALLASEKVASFEWLFNTFLKAMCGRKPSIIITDEDPAMKVAIANVFDTTTHRYCMWHIRKKLPEKVGTSLMTNSNFPDRLDACVWNSETPEEFESTWFSIISDFHLQNNDWLSQKFVMRASWIPAYFKDIFLGGILRTTSRSESENSFFGHFVNHRLTLVEFWLQFDSALAEQRYRELKADSDTLSTMPTLKSSTRLEKHASEVYTHVIFDDFQIEMWAACMNCAIKGMQKENDMMLFNIVDHESKRNSSNNRSTGCRSSCPDRVAVSNKVGPFS